MESYRPKVGEVYLAETWIFSGTDPKASRPVVVVREPGHDLERVFVIGRTSDVQVLGVRHAADPSLGLTKPGVFSLRYLRSAEARYFRPPQVKFRGRLPEPFLSQILKLYENE
ncbi:MAG: hypothetical protein ACRDJG_04975 [Actinomycetota bacterium]